MSKQQAESVLALLQQEYPQAGTQLNYHDLFQLLVAVILWPNVQTSRLTG